MPASSSSTKVIIYKSGWWAISISATHKLLANSKVGTCGTSPLVEPACIAYLFGKAHEEFTILIIARSTVFNHMVFTFDWHRFIISEKFMKVCETKLNTVKLILLTHFI